MKRIYPFTIVALVALTFLSACKPTPAKEQEQVKQADSSQTAIPDEIKKDSVALFTVFEKLKTNKDFLKELALNGEKHYRWNDLLEHPIWGDLDGDGVSDALLSFSIENRGGGNNFDLHYAVFLNKNSQWQYQSQFDANAGSPDLYYEFKKIENIMIKGEIMSNNDDSYEIPVAFIFKDKSLVNTFTALHQTIFGGTEYLTVNDIQTPENISVPLFSTLKNYQQLLGKGKIERPTEQPECGTYFGEGEYSELHYPHLIFEVNNNKEAAFQSLTMKNSGFKLQTDKGTITEKTTLNELQTILYKNEGWWLIEEEDGGRTLMIFDGEISDSKLLFYFNKNGELISIGSHIPC